MQAAEPVLLRYHLPAVGRVAADLHAESARLYRVLDQADELERLRHLDHLGAVRLAVEGAHHPRWEYAMTMFALIARAKGISEIHLSNEVRLGDGSRFSSGSELLKCWTLLLNVGHLVWTFSTERLLLLELWRRRESRREFVELFPADLRPWAERLLRDGRVYSLFQALGLVRLRELCDAQGVPTAELALWSRALREYSVADEASDQTRRLRPIYQRLRRIAYLGLDTHYVPTPVSLNLGQVLADPDTLVRLVAAGDEAVEDELTGLDAFLGRHVYLGSEVLTAVAARERTLRRWLRRSLETEGVLQTITDAAHGLFQPDLELDYLQPVVRLDLRVDRLYGEMLLRPLNPRIEQEQLDRRLAFAENTAHVAVWPVAGLEEWVVQYHAQPGLSSRAAALSVAVSRTARLHSSIATRWSELLGEDFVQRELFDTLAEAIIIAALRMFFAAPRHWEWSQRVAAGVNAALASRKALRRLVVTERTEQSRNRSRVAELDSLLSSAAASAGGLRGGRN
jgi:hypothetical protein